MTTSEPTPATADGAPEHYRTPDLCEHDGSRGCRECCQRCRHQNHLCLHCGTPVAGYDHPTVCRVCVAEGKPT